MLQLCDAVTVDADPSTYGVTCFASVTMERAHNSQSDIRDQLEFNKFKRTRSMIQVLQAFLKVSIFALILLDASCTLVAGLRIGLCMNCRSILPTCCAMQDLPLAILNIFYLTNSVFECVNAAKDRSKSGVCDLDADGTTTLLILSAVTSAALFAGSLTDMLTLKDKLRQQMELEKALEAATAELLVELDGSVDREIMNKVEDVIKEQAKRRTSLAPGKVHPDSTSESPERRSSLRLSNVVGNFESLAP